MGKRKHHPRRPGVQYQIYGEGRAPQQNCLQSFYHNTGLFTKTITIIALLVCLVITVGVLVELVQSSRGDDISDGMRHMTDLARCKATCISTYLKGPVYSDEKCGNNQNCDSCWSMCEGAVDAKKRGICNDVSCNKGCRTACRFMESPPFVYKTVDPDSPAWQFPSHPTVTYQEEDLVTVRYSAVDPFFRGAQDKTAVYMFLVTVQGVYGYALAGITANGNGIKLRLPHTRPGFEIMICAITPDGVVAGVNPGITSESQHKNTREEEIAFMGDISYKHDVRTIFGLTDIAGQLLDDLKKLKKIDEDMAKLAKTFDEFKDVLDSFEEDDDGKLDTSDANLARLLAITDSIDSQYKSTFQTDERPIARKKPKEIKHEPRPAAIVTVSKNNTLIYTE